MINTVYSTVQNKQCNQIHSVYLIFRSAMKCQEVNPAAAAVAVAVAVVAQKNSARTKNDSRCRCSESTSRARPAAS